MIKPEFFSYSEAYSAYGLLQRILVFTHMKLARIPLLSKRGRNCLLHAWGAGKTSDTEVATGLVRSTLFASPFCHCPLRESVFDRNAQTVPLRQACACSGEVLPHILFATDTREGTD